MDADENLAALKKAYADVIMRISEEAATRVIGLERKSLTYQHELKMAKEEGVRMLLRLKQMMDHQVKEAQTATLSQQEKIAELEAQLEEAEDIVRGLREELEHVQTELERVRKENLSRVGEPDRIYSGEVHTENEIHLHQTMEPKNVSFDVGIPHGNECCLPSIISRSKDPGLYRNGCTQRIRACEGNHMDTDMTSKRAASKQLLSDIDFGSSQSFPWKRKRTSRRRKIEIASGRKQSIGLLKPQQLTKDCLATDPVLLRDSAHSDGNSCKTDPKFGENAEEVDVVSSIANPCLSEAVNGTSNPLLNGKVVKFTYQRKRKRDVLIRTEENASLTTEKKPKDTQSCYRKVRKAISIVSKESARERRMLAQVAQQLLSLSGRK